MVMKFLGGGGSSRAVTLNFTVPGTSGTLTTLNGFGLLSPTYAKSSGAANLSVAASTGVVTAATGFTGVQSLGGTATATDGVIQPFTLNFTSQAAAPALSLDFTGGNLPSGATLTRASSGTRFNVSGTLVSEASNVARFDYDPTSHAALGLLVEAAQTNLAQDYTMGNFPAWRPNGFTMTANSGTAPDGTNTATQLSSTGTASVYAQNVTGLTPNTAYVFSFYAKRGTTTDARYSVYDTTNNIEITGGSVSYYSQINSSTWTRIVIPFTTPAGCTSVNLYGFRDTMPAGNMYFWGAQLEAGTVPSSLILSPAAATASRAADATAFTIPAGITTLTYTFDDNSTQVITGVSAGAYTVPTTLNRPRIKTIVGS